MTNSGHQGYWQVTNETSQVVVIEPRHVVDGAATADDDNGIRLVRSCGVPRAQSQLQHNTNLLGCALPLESAVGISEATYAEILQPIGLSLEVAEPSPTLRRHHQHGIEIPGC